MAQRRGRSSGPDPARPVHPGGAGPVAGGAGGSGGPLPPAQMAVRVGRSGPAGRLRRRLVEFWVVGMALDALVAWGAWQLPAGPAAFLLALCALGALCFTVVLGLVVTVLSRASVAAGEGWVGYRVLGRWRVVRRVLPDVPGGWAGSGPGTRWDGSPWAPGTPGDGRPGAGTPGDQWPPGSGPGPGGGPPQELGPGPGH